MLWGLEVGRVLQTHYASITHKISMTALFMPRVLALLACFGNIFSALSCTGEKNEMTNDYNARKKQKKDFNNVDTF